jgi:hypothetical protein
MILNENLKTEERDQTYFKKGYHVVHNHDLRKAAERYRMAGIWMGLELGPFDYELPVLTTASTRRMGGSFSALNILQLFVA